MFDQPMTCALCPNQHTPNGKPSDWRAIQIGNITFYICPAHFPADGATKDQYAKAYTSVLSQLLTLARARAGAAN